VSDGEAAAVCFAMVHPSWYGGNDLSVLEKFDPFRPSFMPVHCGSN
jgi:hypothetical protein